MECFWGPWAKRAGGGTWSEFSRNDSAKKYHSAKLCTLYCTPRRVLYKNSQIKIQLEGSDGMKGRHKKHDRRDELGWGDTTIMSKIGFRLGLRSLS